MHKSVLSPISFKSLQSDGNITVNQDSRTISGYASVFGNVDFSGDIIEFGAFTKSIQERGPDSSTNRKITFLWNHDLGNPLGRITKLQEDKKGLYFEADIDPIPEGDRLLIQLGTGTVNQFSIGYQTIRSKTIFDNTEKANRLKEVVLWEISALPLGDNELTSFNGLKSLDIQSEANGLDRLTERVLKTLDIETQYNVRKLIAKHIALAIAEPLEIKALDTEDKPHFDLTNAIINTKFIN